MPVEAWIALSIGIVTLFFTIIGATWYLSGQTAKTSTSLSSLDGRVTDMAKAMGKMEETLQTVATQKEQIQSLRDTMTSNTKRTDETFNRVFDQIAKLQERLTGQRSSL